MTASSRIDLEKLYREYGRSLVSYIRFQFGAGPPDPEDVVQEAFVRLARKDDDTPVAEPKAFLKVTARNIAIDARRGSVRGDATLKNVAILQENALEIDAMDVISSRDELERLAVVIDTLKPKERVALLMHRIDGLSFAEIARKLNVSPSGARFLVKSALETCIARTKR